MRSVGYSILVGVFAVASASAQGAPPVGPGPGRPAAAARLLLANTGELGLTDAQVVKLAAIARRQAAQRQSMRAAMDSARTRVQGGAAMDSAARRQFRDRMRADMQRTREQARTDQRDAIAVLTPDQQARAWELVANRGGQGRGGWRGRGIRGGRPGRGMGGMGGMRGMRRGNGRMMPGARGPGMGPMPGRFGRPDGMGPTPPAPARPPRAP